MSLDLSTPVAQRVAASFARQGMMQHLEAKLIRIEAGEVEIALPYGDKVTQQQGGFHGGAMGALADIAGGYAALTVRPRAWKLPRWNTKSISSAANSRANCVQWAKWSKAASESLSPPPKSFTLMPKASKVCALSCNKPWCLWPKPIELIFRRKHHEHARLEFPIG
jgi:hypothetical protein